jgi:hypothetical protein
LLIDAVAQITPPVNMQLLKDVVNVVLDSLHFDPKPGRDLLVA